MKAEAQRLRFGEAYTDAMGDVAQRLRWLEDLLESAREAPREEALIFLPDLFSLVVQVCRIVGVALSPGFGREDYVPVERDDTAVDNVLFVPSSRRVLPVHAEVRANQDVHFRVQPEKGLSHEDVQSIHDAASPLVLLQLQEIPSPELVQRMTVLAEKMRERLFECFAEHVVVLPEFGGMGLSHFAEPAKGGAYWFFMDGDLEGGA